MVKSYPRLWRVLIILSLLIAVLNLGLFSPSASGIVAALLILLIGIPHGAADHRIFQSLYTQQYGRSRLFLFYSAYLGLMAGVFLLWFLLPTVALAIFILLSCYHFGQGNFSYLASEGWRSKGLFLLWGAWVLATPILLNYPEALPVLEELLQQQLPLLSDATVLGLIAALTVGVVLWLNLLIPNLRRDLLAREYLSILVLGLVFWGTPLFLGFAVYFALWHALPSALDQIRFLWQEKKTGEFKDYLLTVLPYSLLSFLGLALMLYWFPLENINQYWSVLFMFIAAVTLPHMLLLDRVYHQLIAETE